jgi:hypothetical protein
MHRQMGSFVQEWRINIYRDALIVRTTGTDRVNLSKCIIVLFRSNQVIKKVQDIYIRVDQQQIENAESFNSFGIFLKQNTRWVDQGLTMCTPFVLKSPNRLEQ